LQRFNCNFAKRLILNFKVQSDKVVQEDHPMTLSTKLGKYWSNGARGGVDLNKKC
jgi:hypothetical protein